MLKLAYNTVKSYLICGGAFKLPPARVQLSGLERCSRTIRNHCLGSSCTQPHSITLPAAQNKTHYTQFKQAYNAHCLPGKTQPPTLHVTCGHVLSTEQQHNSHSTLYSSSAKHTEGTLPQLVTLLCYSIVNKVHDKKLMAHTYMQCSSAVHRRFKLKDAKSLRGC